MRTIAVALATTVLLGASCSPSSGGSETIRAAPDRIESDAVGSAGTGSARADPDRYLTPGDEPELGQLDGGFADPTRNACIYVTEDAVRSATDRPPLSLRQPSPNSCVADLGEGDRVVLSFARTDGPDRFESDGQIEIEGVGDRAAWSDASSILTVRSNVIVFTVTLDVAASESSQRIVQATTLATDIVAALA